MSFPMCLGAFAVSVADDVVFFGGTALTRTHLPDLRLSEDIDCWRPWKTAHRRTVEMPVPGHKNCPVAATISAHPSM